MHVANQLPIKTPVCYTVNKVEVRQTLSNFMFASQYEADEFLQKTTQVLKKPGSTDVNRPPTPRQEKFRCLSLDQRDFI